MVDCEDCHGSVAIPQATIAEGFQQDADVWDSVELLMECLVIDLLLKDPPYPFGIREALPHGADWWFARACGLALEGSKAGGSRINGLPRDRSRMRSTARALGRRTINS